MTVTEQTLFSLEAGCRALIDRFTVLSDHGEAAAAAALFTEDGVWTSGKRSARGRAELQQTFGDRPETIVVRHVTGPVSIAVLDAGHASAVTYFLVFTGDRAGVEAGQTLPLDPPFSMGEWHDSLVLNDGEWRIASRVVSRLFQRRR